jgi:hypothetical protein
MGKQLTVMDRLYSLVDRLFDKLEKIWGSIYTQRIIADLLVLAFVVGLVVIELNRKGILPEALSEWVPRNHFYAVGLAFTLLLFMEAIGLIFALAHSVADSLGKQFQVLSLILLRKPFKEFIYFNEPITWSQVSGPVLHILADTTGALLIFIALGFYYHAQQHRPITKDTLEQFRFTAAKKLVCLLLLTTFPIMGITHLRNYLVQEPISNFFDTFYTLLIFSDVLIVLISLRYSSTYKVVFRNSGFALTTVVIRLALTAPPYIDVGLGLCAALLALGFTLAYNAFEPVVKERFEED